MTRDAGASKPYGFPLASELRYALLEDAPGFDSILTELASGLSVPATDEERRRLQALQVAGALQSR